MITGEVRELKQHTRDQGELAAMTFRKGADREGETLDYSVTGRWQEK